ncbi:Myo-inositol 2-dehydrogenase (EC 1.1.1.18), partial [Pseudomonas sp. FEN]
GLQRTQDPGGPGADRRAGRSRPDGYGLRRGLAGGTPGDGDSAGSQGAALGRCQRTV